MQPRSHSSLAADELCARLPPCEDDDIRAIYTRIEIMHHNRLMARLWFYVPQKEYYSLCYRHVALAYSHARAFIQKWNRHGEREVLLRLTGGSSSTARTRA